MKPLISISLSLLCLIAEGNLFSQDSAAARRSSETNPSFVAEPASPGTAGLQPGTLPRAQAAIPRLIKFNGVLHDLSGKPLSGPVDVTFSLYAGEAGGAPLWFEAQTVQADGRGTYTVLLGAMTPTGVPMELFTTGEAHWLGVQVANLPEQSRVLLVSVPYAMKAGDAETLGGKPASAYLLSSQADAHAAASAATLSGLIASGATKTTTSGESPITNAFTQNYIPVFSDNTGSLTNSILTQSGTKIGINTDAPAFSLDLNGNVFMVGTKTAVPGAGGTMRFRDDTGTQRWLFGIPGSAGSQDFQMYNYTNGRAPIFIQNGAASYSLYLHANGNVGIGTTNPAYRLDVAGNVNTTGTISGNGSGLTALNASNLSSGTIPGARLGGTYSGAVNFSNASNVFTGNGAGLANVIAASASNADMVDGLHAAGFAKTVGSNSFSGDQMISGNLSLTGTVNGMTITASKTTSCTFLGAASTCQSANILGGYTGSGGGSVLTSRFTEEGSTNSVASGGNSISDGVVGGTISGGGGTVTTADQTLYDYGNKVTNNWGTVGGGALNQAGDSNGAASENCCETVSGGFNNTASGGYTAVGGGVMNHASEIYSTVGGGTWNVASGLAATVGGGIYNNATAYGATVAGGNSNNATGVYSFAAGCLSSAVSHGAFVWGGADGAACVPIASSGNGQFVANAPGGFWLGNATSTPTVSISHFLDTSTGAYLTAGGAWSNSSDRNLKTAFEPLDGLSLLARIGQLAITSWQYKAEDSIRHIGPMAQDFYAAFGLGNDDKHISTVDEGGVALAGVQALYRLSLKKDAEIQALKEQADDLRSENRKLAKQVEDLIKAQQETAAALTRLEQRQGEPRLANAQGSPEKASLLQGSAGSAEMDAAQ